MLSKSAKRIDFRCFHKKKKSNCEEMDMLISLTVVIISLCIGTSNHHVCLKHIWFLFLKERQMNKKKERSLDFFLNIKGDRASPGAQGYH